VSYVSVADSFEGFIDVVEIIEIRFCFDVVSSGESQHLLYLSRTTNVAADYRSIHGEEVEWFEFDVSWRCPDLNKYAVLSQGC
jgi:hypothetical protein